MDIPHTFGALFFWGFCGVITFLVGIFAFAARSIRDDFKEMSRHLHSLALNLASLTARLESLDARLEKLERLSDD